MFRYVDNIINSITMYRLVLYALAGLAVYSILFGLFGILPYSGLSLTVSLIILIAVCYSANWVLSKLFNAPVNVESWLITALILFFLFLPATQLSDYLTLVLAGVIAMASKYLFAINKKHIFNPAAVSAVLLSFFPSTVAIWWVGNPVMLPVVLAAGLLIVRKIRKGRMLGAFILSSIISMSVFGLSINNLSIDLFTQMILSGPLIFLGTIMLTEPLTTPPIRKYQMVYACIAGLIYSQQFNIGVLYSTPELALVIANIFSFIVSPKTKLILSLKSRQKIALNIYEFSFVTFGLKIKSTNPKNNPKFESIWKFKAGQYAEWTLPHNNPDSRGVRRYFTISSAPSENEIRLGIRINTNRSSYKSKLLELEDGGIIMGMQFAGDFILPEDQNKKLVFIAGGIGITPFRSMIHYLLDKKEKRDITLFYFNKTADEIAYKDVFDRAVKEIGLKIIYILTDRDNLPNGWSGRVGRFDLKMLSDEVPDNRECIFYLSGPNVLVDNYKHILMKMGLSRFNIKTDYFSGY